MVHSISSVANASGCLSKTVLTHHLALLGIGVAAAGTIVSLFRVRLAAIVRRMIETIEPRLAPSFVPVIDPEESFSPDDAVSAPLTEG